LVECLDEQGHDYSLIGYLVCADRKSEERPVSSAGWPMGVATTSITIGHFWTGPTYLTADIEVYLCKKCGDVKFLASALTKIFGGK